MAEIRTRFATAEDVDTILQFIHRLAEYEHMEADVVATPELLRQEIFEKGHAQVLFALDETDKPVAIALFFHNFSTFLGRSGIYLEDLFVLKEHRGKGYGTALLRRLAQLALERGCGRLEWSCLDWNRPSIDYYLSLNATPMSDWTGYRLTGPTLEAMARG